MAAPSEKLDGSTYVLHRAVDPAESVRKQNFMNAGVYTIGEIAKDPGQPQKRVSRCVSPRSA